MWHAMKGNRLKENRRGESENLACQEGALMQLKEEACGQMTCLHFPRF